MELSVVICTHRRPQLLARALDSLVAQEFPRDRFEVVVIDNNDSPTLGLQEICARLSEDLVLHLIHDPVLGASHARNSGAAIAQGRYLAFLDDDAVARLGWIANIVNCTAAFSPHILGGSVFPLYETKPIWLKDQYVELMEFHGPERRWLEQGEYLHLANFVVYKECFDRCGGFPEDFGPVGGRVGLGDENYFMEQAWKKLGRVKVLYDPAIAVDHLVRPERMLITYLARRSWVSGRAQVRLMRAVWGDQRNRTIHVLHLLKHLATFPLPLLRMLVARRRYDLQHWQQAVVELGIPWLRQLGSRWEAAVPARYRSNSTTPTT